MAKKVKRKNRTISFYRPNGRFMGTSMYKSFGAVSEANNWIRSGNYVIVREKNGKETIKGKKNMKKNK
jgi:hypothetical protein